MKTVKKNGEFKRVDDMTARGMVKDGWSYCPKSEWKATLDKTPKAVSVATDAVVSETVVALKLSKKQKRKNEKLIEKLILDEPKKK